jgi:hypothetical protein
MYRGRRPCQQKNNARMGELYNLREHDEYHMSCGRLIVKHPGALPRHAPPRTIVLCPRAPDRSANSRGPRYQCPGPQNAVSPGLRPAPGLRRPHMQCARESSWCCVPRTKDQCGTQDRTGTAAQKCCVPKVTGTGCVPGSQAERRLCPRAERRLCPRAERRLCPRAARIPCIIVLCPRPQGTTGDQCPGPQNAVSPGLCPPGLCPRD